MHTRGLVALLLVLVIVKSAAADAPVEPQILVGFVFKQDGVTPQENATVTLRHIATNETLTFATESDGSYLFMLTDLSSVSAGDVVEITATYGELMDGSSYTLTSARVQCCINLTLGLPIWEIMLNPNPTRGNASVNVIVRSIQNMTISADVASTSVNLINAGFGNYSGSFSAPPNEGNYTFTVRVHDIYGGNGTDSKVLVVDNTPPSLSVSYPANGTITTSRYTEILGVTEPYATITINDIPIDVNRTTGGFRAELVLDEGTNEIVVSAMDVAGNTKTVTLSLIYSLLYIYSFTIPMTPKGGSVSTDILILSSQAISSVETNIIYPSGTTYAFALQSAGGNTYRLTLSNLTELGDYNVTVAATSGSKSDYRSVLFEVYENMEFSGRVLDSSGNPVEVNFTLYRPNTTTVLESIITFGGRYNETVHKRRYDLRIDIGDITLVIYNVDFESIGSDSIKIDKLQKTDVSVGGYTSYGGIVINTTFDISDYAVNETYRYGVADIASADNLRVLACDSWDYGTKKCSGSWVELPYYVDKTNTYVSGTSRGYTAYANGEVYLCGNGVCDPSETCYTCETDCGECPPPTVSVNISGGAGGGRTDITPLEDAIKELKGNVTEGKEATLGALGKGIDILSNLLIEQKNVIDRLRSSFVTREQASQLVPGTQTITADLQPREYRKTIIHVRNPFDEQTNITIATTEDIKNFVKVNQTSILMDPGTDAPISVETIAPEGALPGTYYGEIKVSAANLSYNVPVNIRIGVSKETPLELRINMVKPEITRDEPLRVDVLITNFDLTRIWDTELRLQLLDIMTDSQITEGRYNFTVNKSVSVTKELALPEAIEPKRYMVKGILSYRWIQNQTTQISAVTYVEVVVPILQREILGVRVWKILVGFAVVLLIIGAYFVRLRQIEAKKRYIKTADTKELPQPGPRSGFVGMVAETSLRAFIELEDLKIHTLVAGATGSGKSFAAQVIIEEALKKNVSVICFDPTAQWTGFLRPNKDKGLFKLYKVFNMKESEARAFKGNVYTVDNALKRIEVMKYLEPGAITVFCLNKLDPSEIDILVAHTIQEVFRANLPESKELKLLLIYDEVHRLLPKFGGSGRGFTQIERAAREFRKWGLGLVLISQVLSDFVGEVKANIGTEMQMRTRYEGDLERVKMKYGEDYSQSIVKARVGTGMVQNAKYNRGQPYFVTFRPVLHSTARLSDEELANYDKYNKLLQELRDRLDLMKPQMDVFDLELELNLTYDNLRRGAFDVVDMYMESFKPRIEKEYDALVSKGKIKRTAVEDLKKEREKEIDIRTLPIPEEKPAERKEASPEELPAEEKEKPKKEELIKKIRGGRETRGKKLEGIVSDLQAEEKVEEGAEVKEQPAGGPPTPDAKPPEEKKEEPPPEKPEEEKPPEKPEEKKAEEKPPEKKPEEKPPEDKKSSATSLMEKLHLARKKRSEKLNDVLGGEKEDEEKR